MTARTVTTLIAGVLIAGAWTAGPVVAEEKLLRGIPSAQQWTDELAPDADDGGPTRAIAPTHGLEDEGGKGPAKASGASKASARSAAGKTAAKAAPTTTAKPKAASAPILFEYNSAELTPTARRQLDELAFALQSDTLNQYAFRVEGYTDATGSDDYNKTLSERRAEAVVHYLVTAHGIDPRRLSAIGRGEADLFNPTDPGGAENRRVRLVNLGNL